MCEILKNAPSYYVPTTMIDWWCSWSVLKSYIMIWPQNNKNQKSSSLPKQNSFKGRGDLVCIIWVVSSLVCMESSSLQWDILPWDVTTGMTYIFQESLIGDAWILFHLLAPSNIDSTSVTSYQVLWGFMQGGKSSIFNNTLYSSHRNLKTFEYVL